MMWGSFFFIKNVLWVKMDDEVTMMGSVLLVRVKIF